MGTSHDSAVGNRLIFRPRNLLGPDQTKHLAGPLYSRFRNMGQSRPSFIESSFVFLRPNEELYTRERPYTFKFPPNNGCPQSNLVHDRIDGIRVENMRGREEEFQFEKNGFTMLRVDHGLTYEDHFNETKRQEYFRLMELILKKHLGASRVEVFRHGIRKRHPQFPISHGNAYEFEQPTTGVHVDTSPEGTRGEIRRQYGAEADDLLKKRFQWINFWKPLRGPTNDWPLILCDSSLINPMKDLEVSDLLYPELATENSIMYYRDGLKFYFLSDHQPDEVLIFKQMDSDNTACPGVPHVSGHSPLVTPGEGPRESLEARALVFYD